MGCNHQKCGSCNATPATIDCDTCHNIHYCSTECQQADQKVHQSICAQLANFSERPDEDKFRAILLPADGTAPRFMWLTHASWLDGKDIEATFGGSHETTELSDNYGLPAERPRWSHQIVAAWGANMRGDGSPPNACLAHLSGDVAARQWCGKMLLYAEPGKDLDTVDFSYAIQLLASFAEARLQFG